MKFLSTLLPIAILSLPMMQAPVSAQSTQPQDPALMRLGNGIAAVAEGTIITLEGCGASSSRSSHGFASNRQAPKSSDNASTSSAARSCRT